MSTRGFFTSPTSCMRLASKRETNKARPNVSVLIMVSRVPQETTVCTISVMMILNAKLILNKIKMILIANIETHVIREVLFKLLILS